MSVSIIEQARNEEGLSQADFSKMTGISLSSLKKIERGIQSKSDRSPTVISVARRHKYEKHRVRNRNWFF